MRLVDSCVRLWPPLLMVPNRLRAFYTLPFPNIHISRFLPRSSFYIEFAGLTDLSAGHKANYLQR